MNNHHTSTHSPTARCKTYAPLLAILDEPGINPDALTEVRAHLSACAYCQEQHAAYRQLEVAARRYFAPPATPRYQTEEIMRDLLGTPAAASFEIEPETPKLIPARISTRKPRSPRRFVSSLASLAAVLVIVVVSVTLFASRMHTQGGTRNGAATPGTIHSSFSSLADISMVSPTEGWAVGVTGPCTIHPGGPNGGGGSECQGTDPLLMHYQNGKWSHVRLPFKGQLNTISMLSATDGWASGYQLIMHYDGHTWQQMPHPDHLTLMQMQMLSDSDGWAIANIGDAASRLNEALVHYDGHTWTAQPLPASLGLSRQRVIEFNDLTMISPTEGWVLATLSTESSTPNGQAALTAVILHYANGNWTVQSSIQGAGLLSISMLSATDGWAVGFTEIDTPMEVNGTPQTSNGQPVVNVTQHPLLLHYSQRA